MVKNVYSHGSDNNIINNTRTEKSCMHICIYVHVCNKLYIYDFLTFIENENIIN